MEENKLSPKIVVNFCIYFNSCIAILDRIFQIVYYTNTTFINSDIQNNLLCFIILKPVSLILIYSIYIFTLEDLLLDCIDRSRLFLCFVFSQEASFLLGTQYSIKSKYSRDGDSPLFTTRVLNAFHIMLVSVPQLIGVIIHSTAIDYFGFIETLSILFSGMFILWSIIYMFICGCYSEEIDNQINDMIY